MSKVLVLLSGYPCARSPWGNSQNHGTPDLSSFETFYAGAEYLKKLLKDHSVDYICTTWDDVGEELICDTYEPLIYQSYSQDIFRSQVNEVLYSYEVERMRCRTEYYRQHGIENDLVVSSIRFASQLQSRCNAARLALDLIFRTANSYDAILLTRYDISSRGGFLVRHPTFLKECDFSFLASSVDEPKFILPSFGQLNSGFPDMWFYMNLAGLRHYSLILDNYISDITSSSSEYFRLMTKGWPFSREFLLHSIFDYRQYSNEILRLNSKSRLMKYPAWEVSNLHAYHKYYLSLTGAFLGKSNLIFKGWFDVVRAVCVCSNFSSNIRQLFIELLSYLKFSLRIFFSRFTVKD